MTLNCLLRILIILFLRIFTMPILLPRMRFPKVLYFQQRIQVSGLQWLIFTKILYLMSKDFPISMFHSLFATFLNSKSIPIPSLYHQNAVLHLVNPLNLVSSPAYSSFPAPQFLSLIQCLSTLCKGINLVLQSLRFILLFYAPIWNQKAPKSYLVGT